MTPTFASSDVSLFNFGDHKVRVVNRDNTPWFVAVDLYKVLFGRTTSTNARTWLKADEALILRKVSVPDTLSSLFEGTRYRIALLAESAVYKLVMRSDKPEAKAFQDWVAKEVLPAIRKDGAYFKDEEKVRTGELSEDEFVFRAMEIMRTKIERLTTERDEAQAVIKEHLETVTVDEWRALNHLYLDPKTRIQLGQKASKLMKERGETPAVQIRELPQGGKTRTVRVNLYARTFLDEVGRSLGVIN